jgi:hypothetical protein
MENLTMLLSTEKMTLKMAKRNLDGPILSAGLMMAMMMTSSSLKSCSNKELK